MEDSTTKMDRISDLLSFLPTKIAFSTTVLSKRWTPLCHSLAILRFDDETVHDYANFNRLCGLIDKLMLSPRFTNQSIKTFSLNCRFVLSDHIFDSWVEAAKRLCVEEFHLSVFARISNDTIFTCQTLVVLKLEMLQVEAENLCCDLPLLKTLHLRLVWFKNQNVLQHLLNASPNLEDLSMYHTLYNERYENSALERFKSLSLAKLVRAEIHAIDVPYNVVNNVEFLCIADAQEATLKSFPVFPNLIHIKLWFCCYFFPGWDGIGQLLQHCPKLQILFIRKWSSSLSIEWKCPISNIECVSSHLRSCTILNFEGSANNLRFAKYILQNARFLQDMTIDVDVTTISSKEMLLERSQIIEELSSCPMISPTCKLSFK